MKLSVIAVLIMIATGCGRNNGRAPGPEADAAVQPYVDAFIADVGVPVDDVGVGFTPLPLPKVGKCDIYTDGSKHISFDPDYWNDASDILRQEMVYHELGHCVLHLPHNPNTDGECPVSVMYPTNSKKSPCFEKHKDYYIEELKSHVAEDKKK